MTVSSEIVYLKRMKITEQLKRPIREEMELFEGRFSNAMSSKVALLNRITHYIVNRKGKQMRPMFVFLTSKLLGKTNDRTYRAASVIELIHTATLVHDDVVDDSNKRRGFSQSMPFGKIKLPFWLETICCPKDYSYVSTIKILTCSKLFQLQCAK